MFSQTSCIPPNYSLTSPSVFYPCPSKKQQLVVLVSTGTTASRLCCQQAWPQGDRKHTTCPRMPRNRQ